VTRQVGSSYKGATVYGWVLMLTGLFLLFSGLANLWIDQNVTPPSTRFGNSRPISIVFSIAQGLLFVATGIAIIRKKRIETAGVGSSSDRSLRKTRRASEDASQAIARNAGGDDWHNAAPDHFVHEQIQKAGLHRVRRQAARPAN